MKNAMRVAVSICLLVLVAPVAFGQEEVFSQSLEYADSRGLFITLVGVAVDETSVYVAGSGVMQLDPCPPPQYSCFEYIAILFRFDKSGNEVWNRIITPYQGWNVAVDDTGVYISGLAIQSVSMSLLRKYDKNGNELWTRHFSPNSPTKVATDGKGNVYTVGGGILRKFDAAGNEQWLVSGSGGGSFLQIGTGDNKVLTARPLQIVDEDGLVLGNFPNANTATLGLSALAADNSGIYTSSGEYLTKFDQFGNALWFSRNTLSGYGHAANGLSLNNGRLYRVSAEGNNGVAVLREHAREDGRILWTYTFPGTSLVGPFDIASDAEAIYVVGERPAGNVLIKIIPPNTLLGAVPVNLAGGVSQAGGVSLSFSNVTVAGNTTLTVSSSGPPPPAGFKLGNPSTYYEFSTTAAFTGTVTICINYANVGYGNETKLKLFHYENGAWSNVTTQLDTGANVICGTVFSLSPFAVFEENTPPVASIAPVAPAILGESLTFNGSVSHDSDGAIVSYTWTFGDNTTDSGVVVSHIFTAAGTYQVLLTVTDNYGATGTATATVTVETLMEAINNLISLVQSMNLAQGITNSLDQKLQNAIDALNAANSGNRSDALNKLNAFINATQAQSGNQLTSDQANQLIAAVNRIIAVL